MRTPTHLGTNSVQKISQWAHNKIPSSIGTDYAWVRKAKQTQTSSKQALHGLHILELTDEISADVTAMYEKF